MENTRKVGELAQLSGLTVRTLHHYDEIGLLQPSERTVSGHRLYTEYDVRRLYQVLALRRMGLSLEDIARHLDGDAPDPRETLLVQLQTVDAEIQLQEQLRGRLQHLLEVLDRNGEASTPAFLDAIEGMAMFEQYFTPEQQQQLERRREQHGDDALRAAESEWPELVAKVQAEMDAGTDPAQPRVQALTRRWQELLESFHGGDEGLAESNRRMWEDNADSIQEQYGGPSREMMDYIRRSEASLSS